MADNFPLTPGSGRFAATDQVTYSGDSADVQLMRPVLVTGSEGSRTVVDLPGDDTNGLDVDVTRVSGNVTVVQTTGSNLNAAVTGTVTANAGTGNFTVVQATASNLNANVSGTVTANAGTGSFTVAQATAANLNATVTGTVTANAGTGSFTVAQATAANLNATVTGTVTANAGTGNFTVTQATASNLNAQVVGAGASGAAVSGNPVLNAGSDGTNARTLKTDTSGNQIVVGAGASGSAVSGNPLLAAGSDGTNARTLKTDTAGVQLMAGDIANDSIDSGNPVKIGGFAESTPSTATMVADADRVNFTGDIDGIMMTKPFTSYGDILVERVSNTDGASTALTTFGATANARNMITAISLYNSSTTNGYVDIRDGTAGTILFTLPLPANGGSITNFTLPLRQTTANTALAFDVSAALTTVYLSFIGFKSKV